MNLHLFIPHMFWPDSTFNEIYQDLSLPAMETLLAKGVHTKGKSQGLEAWLCDIFSVEKQQDLPIAPITLLADKTVDIEVGKGYWLRADPVHLRVEHDQVLLADSRTFRLSLKEACQFVDVINKYFAEDRLPTFCGGESKRELISILPLCPDRWYLNIKSTPSIKTQLLSEVAVKNIKNFYPYGAEEIFWRGILNEIQMLLHEHPLNQIREERGDLVLNGVWFWGGGVMPNSIISPYIKVWSNDIFPRSLAIACGTSHAELPVSLDVWRYSSISGKHFVFLDSLYGKSKYGDVYGWRESIKELEQQWFVPLLNMLKKSILNQLTITTINKGNIINFSISRNSLYKFWHISRPLSAYID